jgi:ferredoxin
MKPISSNFPKKSTRSFLREAKHVPGFTLLDRLHGYVYIRWPYLYIGIAKGDHRLSKFLGQIWKAFARVWPTPDIKDPDRITFADTYHGKVVPTSAASQLVTINKDLRIDDLEKIIPYVKARTIVMKNPEHIVALECPCRSARENPCLPLDVCIIVGDPFASFVIEHHPERSRWVSQSEAVGILEAERERGHVSHAFFKDAMLERFYAICNCCQCCCGAMKAHRNGTPMLASSGFVAHVETELCIGCGDCEKLCQFNAIHVVDNISKIDLPSCMGCGVCEANCKQKAISLVRDADKGIPLEIHELMAEAANLG